MIAELVALPAVVAFSPFVSGTYPPAVQNPMAVGGVLGDVLGWFQGLLDLALLLLLILGLGSLVVRYRNAAGIERQQLKWFAFVGAIAITALGVAGLLKDSSGDVPATIDWFGWLIGIGGLVLMPIAIGIAVLRYRLYDIDRLISRSISWTAITGVLVAVFVAVILLIQAVLAQVTTSNTVAVATSTVVVFALFQPVRRRIQTRVDGRFNRARYDAERTLAAFAGRLRDEVDLQELEAEITATVARTVQPAAISLWIRG